MLKILNVYCVILSFLPKNCKTVHLTPGTFVKEWKKGCFSLSRLVVLWLTPLENLWRCEKILLDNDVLLVIVYVDPMYKVTLANDQQERGRKALVAVDLTMKEHEERISRADEVDENQSFSKGKSSTSGFNDEDFKKHLDQQAKAAK